MKNGINDPNLRTGYQGGSLDQWREKIFFALFLTSVVFGFFAWLTSVRMALENGLYGHAALYTATYLWAAAITFIRRIPFKIRAWSGVSLFYILGVVALFTLGPAGSGRIMLFTFAVTTGLLLGLKAGLVALSLTGIALVLVGVRIDAGLLQWPLIDHYSVKIWITTGTTLIVLAAISSVAAAILVGGLGRVIQKNRKNLVELENANDRLSIEISERKKIEAELIVQREKLRKMSSALSMTEEQEKRKMAVVLHDHIGQDLAVGKYKLQSIRSTLETGEIADTISTIIDICEGVIQRTRSLTQQLSPTILYELGLVEALDWLCEQFREINETDIRFAAQKVFEVQSIEIRLILFRTARELLNNALRHSGADVVELNVYDNDGRLHLLVKDNGRGFDPDAPRFDEPDHFSFGLFSIREGINGIGGRLELESSPGNGTRALVSVPNNGHKQASPANESET